MRPKSQKKSNVIGARGELLAGLAFPQHWVVRKLERDFGVDLDVEVFRFIQKDRRFEATGQHLYVQVKASEKPLQTKLLDGNRVLVHHVESSLLHTVTAMGMANPVLLMHVDVQTGLAHWVCLNDFIDKYLRPRHGAIPAGRVPVYFSPDSLVDPQHGEFWRLEFLSRRPRTVSMFHLAQTLDRELDRILGYWTSGGRDMSQLRSDSGLIGLKGLVDEILALRLEEAGEFATPPMGFAKDYRTFIDALSAVSEALAALRAGESQPNDVLTKAFPSLPSGDKVAAFVQNLSALVKKGSDISTDFEKGARWIGMPFPAPTSAEMAEKLYSAQAQLIPRKRKARKV